ncbi:MAG TPA: hypothetical protein PKE15_00245 [Ottowia sp.]|nr:hypothetical protein [Ottowia sp.]
MATTAKKSAASAARAAQAAQAAAAGEGTLYDVLSNLHHDGRQYAAGEQIALDDVSAEPLLKVGTIKPAEAADAAQ